MLQLAIGNRGLAALAILGLAIAVTNIILVCWFTKKRELTKISYIFLSSLGTSDVLYGFGFAARPILLLTVPLHVYTSEVCRIFVGTFTMAVIMSAVCILLLSVQVSSLLP